MPNRETKIIVGDDGRRFAAGMQNEIPLLY
jgi:hypothetical protein